MKLLYAPDEAILDAKKERSLMKTLIILLISSLLFVATLVIFCQASKIPLETLVSLEYPFAIYVFLGVFLGVLFLGFIVMISVNILGGNGSYFDGLTCVTYVLFPFSIGVLLLTTINLLPNLLNIITYDSNILIIKTVIVFAIGMFFTAESIAIAYRAVKEFFNTDMITSLIGMAVVSSSIVIPFYLTMISSIFQMLSLFSGGGVLPV